MVYDYQLIGQNWSKDSLAQNPDLSIWRYKPLLSVSNFPDNRSIRVGGTPLVDCPMLASKYGIGKLYIKDDTRNPSGSLKDRASEVAIQHASELGHDLLVVASTGNAAASLSALAAFYGKKAVILAPASAPVAKLTQILQYGAKLFLIEGNYDDAFDLSLKITKELGWYSRSTGVNPIMTEGKKTAALEIAESLNWKTPGHVFVPVGDGCIIGGVHKGFRDLQSLRWISDMPAIHAVQANGSDAIVKAIESGKEITAIHAQTCADSISVDLPRDGLKAINAVRNTGGFGIGVSDDEILLAQHELASTTGIFAEPAAAAAFAGFIKACDKGRLHQDDIVVILITGSGLKDIPAAQQKIEIPKAIKPDFEAFRGAMANLAEEK